MWWVSKREYEFLKKEVDYWRERFEEERKRADALTQSLLQTNCIPAPAPRDNMESGEDHAPPAIKRLQMMIPELLADTIADAADESDTTNSQATSEAN